MDAESSGYRFLDPPTERTGLTQGPVLHSVEFHPAIDDYVYIVQSRAKESASRTSLGKFSLQTFFLVNSVGLPAALLIFGHPVLALELLAINLSLLLLFLPSVFRYDYRRYFRNAYGPDFENELIRVELTEDGIVVRHLDDVGFYSWSGVKSIGETTESLFIHLRSSTIPIRKSGFPYREAQQAFVNFARSRQDARRTIQP
jgi:hypothetical protein